jgi:hypothetical protein
MPPQNTIPFPWQKLDKSIHTKLWQKVCVQYDAFIRYHKILIGLVTLENIIKGTEEIFCKNIHCMYLTQSHNKREY